MAAYVKHSRITGPTNEYPAHNRVAPVLRRLCLVKTCCYSVLRAGKRVALGDFIVMHRANVSGIPLVCGITLVLA
jgi:hypothetical protein